MRIQRWSIIWTAGLALLLTGANAAYHLRSPSAARAGPTSFAVGNPFPRITLSPVNGVAETAPLPTAGCRLYVFFSTTCPHCHTAARRDAATADSLRLNTIWVSHTADSTAREFAQVLGVGSWIRYGGPNAFETMKVTGVPSAFLVDAKGIVRWSGGYAGGEESHVLLRQSCALST